MSQITVISGPERRRVSVCIVAGVREVVGAFVGRAEIKDTADGALQAVDGALGGFAQMRIQLGEGLLDTVEVGAVGRKEQESGACGFDNISLIGNAG